MSHFTVTVLIKAGQHALYGAIETAVANMLDPFDENTENPRYLEFQDMEEELSAEYETGTTEKIRTPEGAMLLPWDERFRKPGSFGVGSDTHDVPADCERVQIPFKDEYPTFEAFCSDYHGYERDEKTGRVGYWRNPNEKWDWWTVGGRWKDHFKLKCFRPAWNMPHDHDEVVGEDDVARVDEIDMDAAATEATKRANEWFDKWAAWVEASTGGWDTPRGRALTIGLLRVEEKLVEAGPGEKAFPWRGRVKDSDSRADWTDVARVIDRDTFLREFAWAFNPLSTYALLDEDGWHAPGRMGWFACSSDTPETYREYQQWFMQRLKAAAPDDVLVCVDCHI